MPENAARMIVTDAGADTVLAFVGRLDAMAVARLWRPVINSSRRVRGRPLVFDLSALEACDMAGATLLAAAEEAHGAPATLHGDTAQIRALLTLARSAGSTPSPAPAVRPQTTREVLHAGLIAAGDGFAFLGQALFATIRLPARRRMLRRSDLLRYADQAGVQSLPLVLMLGFLMGLILAFQSAVPMRQFGAELFVANLVSVSLTRELGPLLAAIILAGRTASAFAAEIGTMKVNQEVDALVTMGLDPMTMLVLPRLAAAVLVMPVMAVVLDLAGLLGMAVVMRGFGYPLAIIELQVQLWTTPADLIGGLIKAACFGAVIAAIGCRAGLGTGIGPRAVGLSATAAVVGGIVATIVLDGVFAVFFNRLGI
ncbi:MAG TPA: ABC transporter permease [Acetobacteraceae bacterium]|nr:ABC transporter permease [Acetobacteraceae bacterium]